MENNFGYGTVPFRRCGDKSERYVVFCRTAGVWNTWNQILLVLVFPPFYCILLYTLLAYRMWKASLPSSFEAATAAAIGDEPRSAALITVGCANHPHAAGQILSS